MAPLHGFIFFLFFAKKGKKRTSTEQLILVSVQFVAVTGYREGPGVFA